MNDLRKAAEMLMKALDDGWVERGDNVAIALRQALAQPDEIKSAVLAEREAYAKLIEEVGRQTAAAIRGRQA